MLRPCRLTPLAARLAAAVLWAGLGFGSDAQAHRDGSVLPHGASPHGVLGQQPHQSGQEALSAASRLTSPLFQHLTPSDGLPYPSALAIAQDGEGWLWFGTPGGLARWDGRRMKVFRHRRDDPSSLPQNIVTALWIDADGRLWVGTISGEIARFDPQNERFIPHPFPSDQDLGRIHQFADDGEGGLWAVGRNGLAQMDAAGRWRRLTPDADGVLSGELRAVLRDRRGGVWVGGQNGFIRRPLGAERFEPTPRPAKMDPGGVTALYEDQAGTIWFGTFNGRVGKVDPNTGLARPLASPPATGNRVVSIVETTPGRLWIGEYGGGVAELTVGSGVVRRFRHEPTRASSLLNDSVNQLLTDRMGLVWIAGVGGVSRYNPLNESVVTILPGMPFGLPGQHLRSMALRADGRVWLGFREEGLALLDPEVGRLMHVKPGPGPDDLPQQVIQAVAATANGDVWTGSPIGLHKISPETGIVAPYPPLQRQNILALLAEEGMLWAGGGIGVMRINTLAVEPPRIYAHQPDDPDSLSDNNVQALLRDRAGRLWVGTQRGLNLLDEATGRVRRFRHDPDDPDSLPNDVVNALAQDAKGRIWVGGADGVGVFDPNAPGRPRFLHFNSADGLPHDTVTVLLVSEQGEIWVGGGDGLAVIDPDRLTVRALGAADGAGLRAHWLGSGVRLPGGALLMGGFGGMTAIHPEKRRPQRFDPPIRLTDLRIEGRTTIPPPNDAAILLDAEERSLAVEFAALDYADPDRIRYAYKLEGFDDDWIEVGADRRVAAYTNLDPGSYRLLVRAAPAYGPWGERLLTAPILVTPAWRETWAFRGLALLFAAGAGWAALQGRTAYLRGRQRALELLVSQRTAELEAARAQALTQEAEARRARDAAEAADQAKSRFLAVVSHEIRTPLNGLLGMLQMLDPDRLAGEQRRRLNLARSSGDHLISLIESILDYGRYETQAETAVLIDADPRQLVEWAVELHRPQAAAKGLPIHLDVAAEVPPLIECDSVHLSQVLHNLLSNAVKFTAAGQVSVRLEITRDAAGAPQRLRLEVADTGVGVPPELQSAIFDDFVQADDSIARRFGGAGLGLAVCRRIAVLLGGSLTLDSAVGAGSLFRLDIPVGPARGGGADDAAEAAETAPLDVLLVDDDAVNRDVGLSMLRRLGHRPVAAADAGEALARAAAQRFDLVLMDLHMPEIDGLEAVRRLRAAPDGGPARIMIMTADQTDAAKRRCVAAKIERMLPKPLRLRDLARAVGGPGRREPAARIAERQDADAQARLIDRDHLTEQWELLGPHSLFSLARTFATASRGMLTEIEGAAARGELNVARALAHRLRSAAGAMGLPVLTAAAAKLEHAGDAAISSAEIQSLRDLRRRSLAALVAAARNARGRQGKKA